jgi:hypothetical protein
MMRDTMRSRRILPLLAALLACMALSTPARAQPLPSIADQPAATLLLPYFEVDLANPAGANTLFTINNASASAVLAHVTIWSTMHVPVNAFNIYLTGYDVQTIYLRDVLNGVLPQTASAGQDPTDTISPKGPVSQDINFASCTGVLPSPALAQATIAHIKASLTGHASALAGGLCASIADGTQIAKGYITVDTVNNCTTKTPADAGYFVSGGFGDATNQNVLWGDYVYTNHLGGLESGDGSPLVHVRADATDPATSTAGRYTFYGRVVGWTAADNREPLSTSYLARYVNGGAFTGTNLTVWRDAKVSQSYFSCNGQPSWYPLGQEGVVIFDEQEHPVVPQSIPFAPQPPFASLIPFPAGAQRVAVGGSALPVPFNFGFLYLDLNTTVSFAGPNPPVDPAAAQAWVEVHMKGTGRYSVGWPAAMLDSAKGASHFVP